MKIVNRISIKTKLLWLIVFFLLVPFLFFSYIWYKESSEILERNAADYSKELVEQQNRHLDYYFLNLERATFPLVTHPLIQEFIRIEPDDQFNIFRVSQQINKVVLPEIIGRGDISSFQIVSKSGSTSTNTSRTFEEYNDQKASDLLGFQLRGIQNKYALSNPTITLTRSFLDTSSYLTRGIMIIDLKLNHLKQIADHTRVGKSGFIWITDQNGTVLYHPKEDKIGNVVANDYLNEVHNKQSGSFIKEINGQKKLVTFHKSPITSLMILTEVPLNEVIGKLINIKELTIGIGGFLILTAILLIGGFTYSLTKSLTDLQSLMEETEHGNLSVRAEENREDEIGKVNRSFNRMVNELQRSIVVVHQAELRKKEMEIRQRDSMLKALQSQINPHFLYNTLELINSHAIIEENATISRMVHSLADMFRYNASTKDQYVSLYDEVEHVSSYLEIQKERYPKLRVILDIDQNEIKKIAALRLTLQPIVENIFEHGYENSGLEPTLIHLKGEMIPQGYALNIIDHGLGMDEEVKAIYDSAFNKTKGDISTDSDWKSNIERIGMWNVHSRIRLTYGDNYGLNIVKADREGTTIQMLLPKKISKGEKGCSVS